MCHQITFKGESRKGALLAATRYAGISLLPLTLGLGVSTFVTTGFLFGRTTGILLGSGLTLAALGLLYGLGLTLKSQVRRKQVSAEEKEASLKAKIEQMLTEARVLIPGAQALLGFQFVAMFTKAFAELPEAMQYVYVVGLCASSLAAMILMTPAAIHRIAFDGEDNPRFFVIGSRLVILAALPLAIGIAADIGVVFYKISSDGILAGSGAVAAFALLMALWYVMPFAQSFGRSLPVPVPSTTPRTR